MSSYDADSSSASARTSPAICCGWLCSSGGSVWTATGQPRRVTTSATGWAMAPQAMTAVLAEGELLDEAVVELGAVGELDIGHLLQQRLRARPLPDRQQGHLRALAGDVAGRDDAQHGQLGHQPDPDGRRGREVAAERAGQQHLLHV